MTDCVVLRCVLILCIAYLFTINNIYSFVSLFFSKKKEKPLISNEEKLMGYSLVKEKRKI